KQGLDEVAAINQDRVVVVRPQRWSGLPGEILPVEVRAFGVDGPGQEGVLRWHAGGAQGILSAPGGVIEVRLPTGQPSGLLSIEVTGAGEHGRVWAVGHATVVWASPQPPPRPLRVVDDAGLAETLSCRGYPVAQGGRGGLLVARQYTP